MDFGTVKMLPERGKFNTCDGFDAEGVSCGLKFRQTVNGIMVGQGDGGKTDFLRQRCNLFGGIGAVRCGGMAVQIYNRGILHSNASFLFYQYSILFPKDP